MWAKIGRKAGRLKLKENEESKKIDYKSEE